MTTGTKAFNNISSACVFLAVFGLLFLASSPKNLIFTHKSTIVRKTTTKRNAPEIFQKISDRCEVPKLHVPQEKINPSFLASYPGSGTKLQWELVEAISGIVTTDDGFSNGHHNVIALKTHYPCPAGRLFPGAEEIFKAMIFIRHPMDALPSYHDIIYASENNLSVDPPPRAPLEQWITWRDMSFARELETWRKHFTYWVDRFGSLNRLVVPYEQLTSRKYGPALVIRMADFLRQGNNAITTADATDLPCIWQKILKKVESSGTKESKKLRRRLQQQEMLLSSQQQQHVNKIMEMHQLNTGLSVGGTTQQFESLTSLSRGIHQQVSRSLQQPTQQSIISQVAQVNQAAGDGHRMEQQISVEESRGGGTESNQLDPASDELGPTGEQKGGTDMQLDTNSASDELRATGEQTGGNNIQVDAHPASDELGPTGEQTGGHDLQVNTVSSQANYLTADEDHTLNQGEGTSVVEPFDVDPPSLEVIDEKRDQKPNQVVTTVDGYDAYRPYTENQRKEVVIVLTQLLEIYRDDSVLAPLLVDYIDQITNEQEEQK
jgi:hypothetical protein